MHGPAAGVVGEAMVALVLADAYRQSSAATTSTTCAKRWMPTASGSDGRLLDLPRPPAARASALPMAPASDRRATPAAKALVFIGFMGAGKTTVAGEVARRWASKRSTATACSKRSSAIRSPRSSRGRGEASFRAAEEQLVCRLLDQAEPGTVIALGGGSVLSPSARRARAPPDSAARHRRRGRLEARGGGSPASEKRPLATDREAFVALYASRGRVSTKSWPTRSCPRPRREIGLRALPALVGCSQAPAGTRLLWASLPPASIRCSSVGACCTPEMCSLRVYGHGPDTLASLLRLRSERRPPLCRAAGRRRGADRDRPRRAQQDAIERRARMAARSWRAV